MTASSTKPAQVPSREEAGPPSGVSKPPTRLGSYASPDRAPAKGRSVPGTLVIAIAAGVIGLIATFVVWRSGGLLLYNDAQTHLVIARRVLDSQNTGFQQLGTVWLPMPHILLLPFVAIFPLWQSGLAGGVLGSVCLAVSAAALWRISSRLGFGRPARLVTVAVFVLNPSILYLSTTALTEPVLIAALLSAVAGLSGWITARPSESPGELAIFAGVPTAIAVLSRYEGWAFVAAGAAFVIIASWRRWGSVSYTATLTLSFMAAPIAAAGWWITYNWVRYGDPLDFARGEYSAAAQQAELADLGLLPTKGNLGLAITTYNWNVQNVAGIAVVVIAGLGLLALLWTRGLSTLSLLVMVTGFVYPFAILGLWLGQTAIRNDVSLPLGTFNIRFGAPAVPVIALLVGVMVDAVARRGRRLGHLCAAACLAVILASAAWAVAAPDERMGVVREGNINAAGSQSADEAAVWLGQNYQGGFILIDDVANPQLMSLNVRLDQLWSSYNGTEFERVLANPYDRVNYVFTDSADPSDRVWRAVSQDPNFTSRFFPVHRSGSVTVWQNARLASDFR